MRIGGFHTSTAARTTVAVLATAVLAVPATAAAEPAGLEVTGWVLEGARPSLVDRNAAGITTLSVDGVTLDARGGSVSRPSAGALRLARAAAAQSLVPELLVGNYSERLDDFDPRSAHRLLSSAQRIERVSRQLAAHVSDGGWRGVNVDLERVPARDRGGLVRFVEALQSRMEPDRTVTVDVSASTSLAGYRRGGYALAGLARAADIVRLMTYDQHGPTWSGPGPVGALPWQRRSLATLLRVVPREQVDLGVAGYGYTWPRARTGRTVTVAQARRLVRRDGTRARWHQRAGEWSARLSDGTVLWWSDRRSYRLRVALAQHQGLHGLAVWRLGSADTLR